MQRFNYRSILLEAFCPVFLMFSAVASAGDCEKNIVDTAVEAGSFKTLVAAVMAAGRVDALKGDGPFTVFAPTNDAFAKFPAGTVQDLLKSENRAKVQAILTYHVVPGKVLAKDVVGLNKATSVQGGDIAISVERNEDNSVEGVEVNDANVIMTEILGLNGVVHVINSVILPQ